MTEDSPPALHVYTAHPPTRTPFGLVRAMARDLLRSRELAWQLLVRDLKARYRQSVLGVVWAVVPPVITTALFVALDSSGAVTLNKNSTIPYPAFVLFGMVLWQMFVEAVLTPLSVLAGNKEILTKVQLPYEALILSGIGQVVFDFLIRSLVLIPIFLYYGLTPGWGVLLAPIPIVALLLLGTAVGAFFVPLGLLYTDFQKLLAAGTGLWLFLTPVLFAQPKGGVMAWVILLNPVSALLSGARDLMTLGVLLQPNAFLITSGVTLVLGLGVWVMYRLAVPILIERLGQ